MAAIGIDWEQVALRTFEEFDVLRSSGKLLLNQLPLLEIDGLDLVQSQAMMRYVSRRGGLAGQSPAEEAAVDMLCEGVKDARGPIVSFAFAPEQELAAAALPGQVRRSLVRFEELLGRRADLHLVASGLTAADVLLGELLHEVLAIQADCLADFPRLRHLHGEVVALPGVRSYLQSTKRYPLPLGDVAQRYVANVGDVLGWNR